MVGYEHWMLKDLRGELKARELDSTGTKAKLIGRLEENDEEAEDE